MIEEESSR